MTAERLPTLVGPQRRAAVRSRLLAFAPGAGRARPLRPDTRPSLPPGVRVLILRPDHLGDVLFSGPAVARLRQAWPEAQLTLLVGPWASQLARRLPGVDRVVRLPFPWFDRQPRSTPWQPYVRLIRAAWALRQQTGGPFDAAIVLREDDWWGAWLTALAGTRIRLGHDRPGVRPFLTHALPSAVCPPHTAAAALSLVTVLTNGAGPPSPEANPLLVHLTDADRRQAARLLQSLEGSQRRPVAIHPGSGSAIKRWRATAWVEVIRRLTRPDEVVILTGSAAEAPLTARVAAASPRPTLDLAGRTELGVLAAVFARCRLVLGPDSGPLHLAVAVGTPTVHLFGPADVARFGPWGPARRHRVVKSALPCAPCGRLDWPRPLDHPCVRLIPVAHVVEAARAAAGRG